MRAAFGPFSFDLCALELRKDGVKLRLEEKPARLLACLIQRKGEIVTRDELRKSLWPGDVNLDFDHGLNKTVSKLRAVLGDRAARAKYLETLSKRGYRFIHVVELEPASETVSEPISGPLPDTVPVASPGETGTTEPLDSAPWVGEHDLHVSEPQFRWLSLTVALILLVALIPAARRLGHLVPIKPVTPKHIRIPAGLKLMTQGDATLALSPDGKQAAFAAAGPDRLPMLWLLDLQSSQVKALPGTDGGSLPFWSPDGNRLGFFTILELKTIDLTNYAIKTLVHVDSPRGGSWSSKGVILFAAETRGPIFRIPAEGGTPIPVTAFESKSNATTDRWPAFLSDEDHFVYLEASHNSPDAPGRVMLGSLNGTSPEFLLNSDSNVEPGRDNLAFVLHGKLLSVQLNRHTLKPDSQARVLAEAIDCDHGSWYCSFALNRAGVLYRPQNGTTDRETISWFDMAGNKLADLGQPGVYRSVDLSPDGKTVAVTCGDPDQKVCLIHEDGTMTRLHSDGIVSGSIWSPDSSAIEYFDHRSISDTPLIIQSVSQHGSSSTVVDSNAGYVPIAWSPKGRMVLYKQVRPGGANDLVILDLKSRETIPYLSGLPQVGMARFSPDGRWVAFNEETSSTREIYIASFPKPSVMFTLTTTGGCAAKWRGDGKAIFYLGPRDTLYSVSLVPSSAGFRIGKPTPLFRPPIYYAPWNCISFDVARDGSRFVINVVASPTTEELISMAY